MKFKARDDVPDELENRHAGSRWVMWRPTARGPAWLVRVDIAESDGRLECIGLELRSYRDGDWPADLPTWRDDPAPLTRRTLREVPLGQILDDLGDSLQQTWLEVAELLRGDGRGQGARLAVEWADQIAAQVQRDRARGGRRRGAPELAAIAAVYLDAQRRRKSATEAVAKWGGVSPSTAGKWIMRVRRETDLLPPPTNRPRATTRGKR